MRVTLATKVFLGFSALLAGFALLAGLSVREIHSVAEDLRRLKDGHLAVARLAARLETHQQNRLRDLRRSLEERDPRSRQVVLRIASAYFPDVIRSAIGDLRTAAQNPSGDPVQARFFAGILDHLSKIERLHRRLDELTRALIERQSLDVAAEDVTAEDGALKTLAQKLEGIEVALQSEVFQLDKFLNDETDRAIRRAEREERNAVWRVVAMTMIALLVGVLVTLMAGRGLAPIGRLVRYARAISRGDYDQPIEVGGSYELTSLADELRRLARSRKDREDELDRQALELEQAYRRVEELHRYHESIVRSLRTGVVVTDRHGVLTSVNRAGESFWGIDPEHGGGKFLKDLPLGSALAPRVGDLTQVVSDGQALELEALPIGDRLANVTVAPLESERGRVLGAVIALEDVTEAVRTKEALIQSERLAAIGRMSAHVTHEIRNPLSSIGLNAELLEELAAHLHQEGPEADEASRLCRAITREIDRLTQITEEYLRFARLPQPELVPTALGDLLLRVASFVRPECRAASVDVEVELPGPAPWADIDPDQIRQAILNLLRNAKESMPEGGVVVVSAELGGDEAVVTVRDSGSGIPADALGRIFDPFYSTKLTGTGLGLALTQQIVQEHGGRLEVSSTLGQGSEFRIILNARQPVETSSDSEDAALLSGLGALLSG